MTPFARRLLWGSSIVTGVTGVIYWWMQHMMEPVDPWAVIHHPLQPWVLKAHIIAAPLLVFALGLIATDHIWKHFRKAVRKGRPSGLTAMMVLLPMVLSGYLIQAVTQVGWLAVLVWIHVGTGVVYLVALAFHRLATRRTRPASPRRHRPEPAVDEVSVPAAPR